MSKVIKLTESDLNKLVKKILLEQQKNIQVNQIAKKRFDELYDKVSKGFCVPVFNQGSLMRVNCKDGNYWEMSEYRRLGKD